MTGGGSQLGPGKTIEYCGIDVHAHDPRRGLACIHRVMLERGAPEDTVVEEYLPAYVEHRVSAHGTHGVSAAGMEVGMLLTVEWNPRALLVTLAVVAGAIGWHFTSRRDATSHAEAPTSATNDLVASLPDRLPAGEVMPVARSLGAVAAYDYTDGDAALRALVFEEGPGWYTIVYYSRDGAGYARVHGSYNPTGFDAPRMVGSPPVLAFRSRDMNVDFAFRLRDGRMELEPLGGATLGPGVPVEDPDLPGLTAHPVTP